MSDGIRLVAFLRVKPGEEDSFIEASRPCIAASREEEANSLYTLNRDTSDPARFVFVEQWTSKAALQEHMQTAHFKTWSKAIEGKVEGAPEIIVLDPV